MRPLRYPTWLFSILVTVTMSLTYIIYSHLSDSIADNYVELTKTKNKLNDVVIDVTQCRAVIEAHIEESMYWKNKIDAIDR